ncbi:GNAT family N-acetyltransferase [Kitasatospora purpeofusca]|uniref:GNAT family N-acetyltransferase n=1 Tax=Kitasatospora purpeofusca TaxID=67352 RepID=UPI002A5A0A34|nr:GNAT family N-acetyltransferase [Kitasatospora purpeofusca]MDY0810355.1 GNAT family N-acetyltransferase [Kitasatospora purpeofusca]
MPIRPARPSEAAALTALALRSKARLGYDAAFMAACRAELTLESGQIEADRTTVAEDDGRVLGFVTPTGAPPEGGTDLLFVEPDAVGRGIGRRLVEHLCAETAALGLTRIVVDSDSHAEPFYLALNAARTGTVAPGSIPGRELPLLTRYLTEPAPGR